MPSFRGSAARLGEGAAVVERWVGRERYVAPPLSPVLVPESSPLPDEPPLDEPPPDVDELSWSWLELLQPPPL
ncbi:hypothetical protein ACFRIC_00865 [Streptomyces sp. NPDC056738]|uniref:hypothetical protein n=1 Tax=Streptomyces sp. NPDC056738 TaxID=3345933 RepID=UPI00367EE2A6